MFCCRQGVHDDQAQPIWTEGIIASKVPKHQQYYNATISLVVLRATDVAAVTVAKVLYTHMPIVQCCMMKHSLAACYRY
jgi:hypothetical protein